MKCKAETLSIVLNENEIDDFWNIIMFAKDLHAERTSKKESCMSTSELKLADEIISVVEKFI